MRVGRGQLKGIFFHCPFIFYSKPYSVIFKCDPPLFHSSVDENSCFFSLSFFECSNGPHSLWEKKYTGFLTLGDSFKEKVETNYL